MNQVWVGFQMIGGEQMADAVFGGPDGEYLAARWAARTGGRVEPWPVITGWDQLAQVLDLVRP